MDTLYSDFRGLSSSALIDMVRQKQFAQQLKDIGSGKVSLSVISLMGHLAQELVASQYDHYRY